LRQFAPGAFYPKELKGIGGRAKSVERPMIEERKMRRIAVSPLAAKPGDGECYRAGGPEYPVGFVHGEYEGSGVFKALVGVYLGESGVGKGPAKIEVVNYVDARKGV
jgi:hypothetical protein